jgi:hypothetical protein
MTDPEECWSSSSLCYSLARNSLRHARQNWKHRRWLLVLWYLDSAAKWRELARRYRDDAKRLQQAELDDLLRED